MVHSYKGGTGKTAIAVNLAKYFSKKANLNVLLIEQDIGGPCFTDIFHVSPPLYWNDFYNTNRSLQELIIKHSLFDIICANDDEIKIPDGTSPQSYFVRQIERFTYEKKWLNEKYDLVIFDTHPGYNLSLINSLSLANIVILVSRRDTDILLNTIGLYNKIYAQFKSKKMFIIENQVPEIIPNYIPELLDRKFDTTLKKWDEFLHDKKKISIPLKNDIAYPLSLSKVVPFDNLLFTYINKVAEIITEFLAE